MRLDAVHIRPVHTVQVTDTNRKARYRNVKRELMLYCATDWKNRCKI